MEIDGRTGRTRHQPSLGECHLTTGGGVETTTGQQVTVIGVIERLSNKESVKKGFRLAVQS